MEGYEAIVNLLRVFALAVGSLVIFAGVAREAMVARGPGGRGPTSRSMLVHASLGLDFFVAATLLNLATNGTWQAVATTAFVIAVRKLLTLSLGLGRSPTPPTGSGVSARRPEA